jgi:hypothetical protein
MKRIRKAVTPFWVAVTNTMAGGGKGAERGARIVRKTLLAFPDAIITGIVEASNLMGTGPDDWQPEGDERRLRKIQNEKNLGKANVAAIIDVDRLDVTRHWLTPSVQPFINGRRIKMRVRYTLWVRGRVDGRKAVRTFRVLHGTPPRWPTLWKASIRWVRAYGVDLADWNASEARVEEVTGKKAFIRGVLGGAVPKAWVILGVIAADVDADHRAVGGKVAPRAAKR